MVQQQTKKSDNNKNRVRWIWSHHWHSESTENQVLSLSSYFSLFKMVWIWFCEKGLKCENTEENKYVGTYADPMNATSNQKASPCTSPECIMWNLKGISILERARKVYIQMWQSDRLLFVLFPYTKRLCLNAIKWSIWWKRTCKDPLL